MYVCCSILHILADNYCINVLYNLKNGLCIDCKAENVHVNITNFGICWLQSFENEKKDLLAAIESKDKQIIELKQSLMDRSQQVLCIF